jgi:hypothetical protein
LYSISFSVPRCKRPTCGVDALDDVTVELDHETQHAVRHRVLGAEIDREIANSGFGHNGLTSAAGATPRGHQWR